MSKRKFDYNYDQFIDDDIEVVSDEDDEEGGESLDRGDSEEEEEQDFEDDEEMIQDLIDDAEPEINEPVTAEQLEEIEKKIDEQERDRLREFGGSAWLRQWRKDEFLKRYENMPTEDNLDQEVISVDELGQEPEPRIVEASPIPRRDEMLFLVRLHNEGKENDIVITLMRKVQQEYLMGDERQLIFGAYAAEGLKGYVYVESRSEADVLVAIKGLRVVVQNVVTRVKQTEMINDVFMARHVSQRTGYKINDQIQRGDWVRMKYGKVHGYKGDLGQVRHFQNGVVFVKLKPRIDFSDGFHEGQKTYRAPQRFFDPETLPHVMRDRCHYLENGDIIFRYECYSKGYLIKQVKPSSLLRDFQPSLLEISNFYGTDVNLLTTDKLPAKTRKKLMTLEIGEKVVVIEGDLKGMKGVVSQVEGKQISLRVELRESTRNISVEPSFRTIKFRRHELSKHFNIGDYVKVVNGPRKGQIGFLSSVDSERYKGHMVNELNREVFLIRFDDLRESPKKMIQGSGQKSSGIFEVGDFVNLACPARVGLICRFEHDGTVSILLKTGEILNINRSKMTGKRVPDGLPLFDKNCRQIITAKSKRRPFLVSVLDGIHGGQIGNVLHTYQNYLWLKLADSRKNGGFIVVHCKSVVTHMGTSDEATEAMKSDVQSSWSSGSGTVFPGQSLTRKY